MRRYKVTAPDGEEVTVSARAMGWAHRVAHQQAIEGKKLDAEKWLDPKSAVVPLQGPHKKIKG